MTSEQIKQSKIYSYFHGANIGFQQFLAGIGIFLILLTGVYVNAKREELKDLREEITQLQEDRRNAEDKARIERITAAIEEAQKERDELSSDLYDSDGMLFVKLFKILGYLSILTAAGWIILKRVTFNHEGEALVDEELQRKTVEAHAKAMEKLNIVSEQINRVDPVVLNGVATFNNTGGLSAVRVKGLFGKIFRFIYTYGVFFLTVLSAFVLEFIGNKIVSWLPFIVFFILVLGLAGFVGYKMFIKYQKNSYVSPKKIDELNNFDPKYIEVLGSDDKVRVSLPSIIVYMFSDEQLYVYHQYFDIVTGHIFYEGTTEYFYEDIVGVTSDQKTKKLFKRYGFLKLFRRRINYLNETINVVTKGNIHSQNYIVSMGNSLLDTQFRGMRNLIRQKKEEK